MSIALIVSGIGAIAAAVGFGLLLARCLRAPRGDLVAWSVALLGLLVSLGAQAMGHAVGFSAVSFRAMELGAQVVAPLALISGMTELIGTSPISRFLARLYIPAFGLIALVILGSDPLAGASFSKTWPSPDTHYQLIPNKLLEYGLGPVILITALILLGVAMARSRGSQAWGSVINAVAAAAGAALVLDIPILAAAEAKYVGISLPMITLFAVFCLIAAALTWFAGVTVERTPVDALRGGEGGRQRPARAYAGPDLDLDQEDDGWGRPRRWDDADQAGDFERFDDGEGQGVYRGGGLYRDEPPRARAAAGAGAAEAGYGEYRDDAYGPGAGPDFDRRDLDAPFAGDGYDTGSLNAAVAQAGGPPPAPVPDERGKPSREQLFGQIAIYTLMEDRTADFDRLTERVVGLVRDGEPDTLVFIVHAVPSAPMQRILYEVYRDRDAYERHRRRPYIVEFEADREPYVLATNVIELGLQQAKVSPFPSIADLFGEPGYDTSGFERPDYTREYGSSAGHRGAPS